MTPAPSRGILLHILLGGGAWCDGASATRTKLRLDRPCPNFRRADKPERNQENQSALISELNLESRR